MNSSSAVPRSKSFGDSQARASLLGFDDAAARNRNRELLAAQSEQLIEEHNDQELEYMSQKISAFKEITIGIKNDINTTSNMLDQMEGGMLGAKGLIQGTMTKLTSLNQTATTKQMMYLVLACVVVFLGFYYMVSWFA